VNEYGNGLLWTPLPLEQVLAYPEGAPSPCLEVQIGSRILQVQPGEHGMGVIQRLISADPGDYLDPRWQPGSRIRLP